MNRLHYCIKFPENRVRRNYCGGAGIDKMRNKNKCIDNDRPEEWIGSMVEANNPGMDYIAEEGLVKIQVDGENRLLVDIINDNPKHYLGDNIKEDGTWELSFLYKILDSSMRLHVQAHPSSEFAKKYLGKPYGKMECYYIISHREGIEPYIRLGFQHAPNEKEWKRIVETQDIKAMDECFEKIHVDDGDVWFIPGGMPHAIGEGITMLEIMEPSDLVMRCEFNREGIVVPSEARFMGETLDFCMKFMDFNEYTKDQIREKCRVTPIKRIESKNLTIETLISDKITDCFQVEKIVVEKEATISNNNLRYGVVSCGSCTIKAGDETITLNSGDGFMIAAACNKYLTTTDSSVEIIEVYPGKTMRQ